MEFETYVRRALKRFHKEVQENTHKVGAVGCGEDINPGPWPSAACWVTLASDLGHASSLEGAGSQWCVFWRVV